MFNHQRSDFSGLWFFMHIKDINRALRNKPLANASNSRIIIRLLLGYYWVIIGLLIGYLADRKQRKARKKQYVLYLLTLNFQHSTKNL